MPSKKVIQRLVTEITAENAKQLKAFKESTEAADSWAARQTAAAHKALKGFKVASAGVATVGTALSALTANRAEAANEIANLSGVARANVEEFQRMTFGAKKHGIEQQKLADILKDVNDRVGDFVTTGGGPMADFFEQIAPRVGVTAEQFRHLSGPQALQLFYSSLQKANISQKEMTFHLEAMSSDLALMEPLLKNNGELFRELGNEADKLGLVMSKADIDQLIAAKDEMDKLKASAVAFGNALAVAASPAVKKLTERLNEFSSSSSGGFLSAMRSINQEFFGFDEANIDAVEFRISSLESKLKNLGESKFANLGDFDFTGTKKQMKEVSDELERLKAQRAELQSFDPTSFDIPIELQFNSEGKTAAQVAAEKLEEEAEEKAAEAAKNRAAQLRKQGEQAILQLQRQTQLFGEQSIAKQTEWELENGRYAQLDELQKREIANLSAILDVKRQEKIAAEETARAQLELAAIKDSFKSDSDLVKEEFARKRQLVRDNVSEKAKADALILQLEEVKNKKLARMDAIATSARLSNASQLFDGLAGMTEAFGGRQSGAYKALFAASKAFAVAESIVSIQQGIANAASLKYPANLAAMASVASSTAGLVSTIKGTNIKGMAHDGIDKIPQSGSWFLEKGERVTTENTSAKLDRTLDQIQQGQQQVPQINVEIINQSSGAQVSNVSFEERVLRVMINDLNNDAEYISELQGRTNVQRYGV